MLTVRLYLLLAAVQLFISKVTISPCGEVVLPMMVPYLNSSIGGPGFECGAPNGHPVTNFLFEKGYQVLYLDQRGTGLSTPISPATLSRCGKTPQEQADYIKLFRADNIGKRYTGVLGKCAS